MTHPLNTHQAALRVEIMELAYERFAREGVRTVRVDDIAAAMQISKRTLYEMFGDKEHLLVCSLEHHDDALFERMTSLACRASNALEGYVAAFALKVKDMRGTTSAFLTDVLRYEDVKQYFERRHRESNEHMRQFVRACVDEGLLRGDINLELVLRVNDVMGEAVIKAGLYREFTFEELARTFNETFLRGMCTARGLAVLDGLLSGQPDKDSKKNQQIQTK